MVNAESDLRNLGRKETKDPLGKYPYVQFKHKKLPSSVPCGGRQTLARAYPLLEAPAFKRGQSIHVPRFESLCLNPQRLTRVRSNQYIGLNTRLFTRDKHVPSLPRLKETTSLPPQANNNTQLYTSYGVSGNEVNLAYMKNSCSSTINTSNCGSCK